MLLVPTALSASWSLEGDLWSSPYHSRQTFLGALSYSHKLSPTMTASVTLPWEVTRDHHLKQKVFLPTTTLSWSKDLSQDLRTQAKVVYLAHQKQLIIEGLVKLISDPLLTYCSLTGQRNKLSFGLGTVFAANERWALGAHLDYGKNSFLTYQLFHTNGQDKPWELNYSRSLEGSSQKLGFKLSF